MSGQTSDGVFIAAPRAPSDAGYMAQPNHISSLYQRNYKWMTDKRPSADLHTIFRDPIISAPAARSIA
jgi:hypothetical protein